MANISQNFGSGGGGLTPAGNGKPSLALALRDIADDVELVRVQFNALLAKLDLDAGVTDVNYATLLGIATGSIKTKKV